MKYFIFISLLYFSLLNIYSKDELNVYSARQEVLMKPLIELFEKNNNIKINIIAAKANQLINRIEQEGNFSKADILLTTDVGRLHIAKEKNILQPVKSTKLNNLIPKNLRDTDDYWFGLSLRARILVYNKE